MTFLPRPMPSNGCKADIPMKVSLLDMYGENRPSWDFRSSLLPKLQYGQGGEWNYPFSV